MLRTENKAIEMNGLRKDGSTFPLEISLSSWETAQGCFYSGIIRDISPRKHMEEQLMRAQKLESIGQLAAGIAHEINTPTQYVGDNMLFLKDSFDSIAPVLRKNQELLDACRTSSVMPELVNEIQKMVEDAEIDYLLDEMPRSADQGLSGVGRIAKIVQSMKDFAHPGSVDKKAADLNRAIESTLTVASNEWKYVADVETDYDESLPPVPCVIGEINQVILNMIINSTHAIKDVVGDGSRGKGKIRISTRYNEPWAEIRIADSGGGISESIRQRIFDPFFTTKGVGTGTGQGLAISHSVISEKHKGTIRVESEVGRGSTFIISLPLHDSDAVEPRSEFGVLDAAIGDFLTQ
jgi:signal transduction histidine kinase